MTKINIQSDCELCAFNNPKCTVTAAIIQDNKLLLVKRNHEPFKDMWDLPGGYVENMETLENAMMRELKEELGVNASLTYLTCLPGTGNWKGKDFSVMAFFYLADIGNQDIKLNEENSEYKWVSLQELDLLSVSYDTNRDFCHWLKGKFAIDLERVKELTQQLDSTAKVDEQSLYKAIMNGHVQDMYEGEKLVGLGWIYVRQTMLRKQGIIEDMIVDEEYRGRGIGERILKNLVEWAKKQGVEAIELTTNPKRIAAHKLYEKFGFEIHETDHMLLKL